jgi:hypothetical protein
VSLARVYFFSPYGARETLLRSLERIRENLRARVGDDNFVVTNDNSVARVALDLVYHECYFPFNALPSS